ncbi:hypothetical protein SAMN02745784_02761 [Tissierella praeacuta DSM 18095]|uniref:Uncharacterized protein n=1 Tax=Tissierella praeacuta DSM 18095 TaxID=1123404 RepID=A0A1M4YT96_9FIRM|nr:hypothetical protein [Tissierella praeacuta]TCU71557.1 hypothetical protein EV204_10619 [Tissierella praeacuta]SHF09059.1 hypothetical protein SAMN02745784_02761 [Tissierella praeacuta DSM 18095]SUP00795.1 Uncharacterised protein [Tissierella praeacuta]
MLFNNIVEKRFVKDGVHKSILEMTADEYNKVYNGEYSEKIASEIINHHLERRGDDGRATNIQIEHEDNSNMVRIYANINYLGNDHTRYGMR